MYLDLLEELDTMIPVISPLMPESTYRSSYGRAHVALETPTVSRFFAERQCPARLPLRPELTTYSTWVRKSSKILFQEDAVGTESRSHHGYSSGPPPRYSAF